MGKRILRESETQLTILMAIDFEIVPIAEEHVSGFRSAVDSVARESKFLASLEGPKIENARAFVQESLRENRPHYVAIHESAVIGWCDISPLRRPLHAHVGVLGMGVLLDFRGQGVGRALIVAAIERAKAVGLTRIELVVREENTRAIALYERVGFTVEGLKRRSTRIDGRYHNDFLMGLLLPETLVIRRYLASDREAVWDLHVSGLEAVGARAKNPSARIDADFDDINGAYLDSGGEFVVGLVGDRIVAMGALKRMSGSVAEIARMRVHPEYWRCGYGEAILHHLEAVAADLAYMELWLDTLSGMIAAQNLYRKNGFQEFQRVHLVGYVADEAILFRKVVR
jgi:ribosomal protein S18 acetylase RimI-like enzyme